jgi:nucleoid-associated protein YgaU
MRSLEYDERMFGKILMLAALVLIAWAIVARASQGAGPTVRYTVKPGDTLWSIAVSHYASDPREAIYRIDRKNRLRDSMLVPGQSLVLP